MTRKTRVAFAGLAGVAVLAVSVDSYFAIPSDEELGSRRDAQLLGLTKDRLGDIVLGVHDVS